MATATKELLATDLKTKQYEQNVKLCRAVEAHPCVYDRELPYEKESCDRAWEAISRACGERVVACKVRWRNIRTAFMRSLQTHSKKRPPNRTRDYYLHEALAFYAPHVEAWLEMNRPGEGNVNNDHVENDNDVKNVDNDKDVDDVDTDNYDHDNNDHHVDNDDDDENESLSVMAANVKDTKTVDHRRRRDPSEDLTISAEETIEDDQKSPTSDASSKARVTSRVGTFIIKNATTTIEAKKEKQVNEDHLVEDQVNEDHEIKQDQIKKNQLKVPKNKNDQDQVVEDEDDEEELVIPGPPPRPPPRPPTAPRLGRPPKRRSEPEVNQHEHQHHHVMTIEDLENEVRNFRFRRACKRNLDRSVVQQLRDDVDVDGEDGEAEETEVAATPSPTESKRPRRSLPPRKTTQQQPLYTNLRQYQRRTPKLMVSPTPSSTSTSTSTTQKSPVEKRMEREGKQMERDEKQMEREGKQTEREGKPMEREGKQMESDEKQMGREGKRMGREEKQMERYQLRLEREEKRLQRDQIRVERLEKEMAKDVKRMGREIIRFRREEKGMEQGETRMGREETRMRREESGIGREETRMGREETRMGREETRMGREETRMGREETRMRREEDNGKKSDVANVSLEIHHPEPMPDDRWREWEIEGGNEVAVESSPKIPKIAKIESAAVEKAIQCDQRPLSVFDDEFLRTLRPQMAAMNARQRLHFKQKVYRSLMEVFDDAEDFPGGFEDQQRGEKMMGGRNSQLNSTQSPSTSTLSPSISTQSPSISTQSPSNSTQSSSSSSQLPSLNLPGLVSEELRLIRELAALVQASKLTPELLRATTSTSTSTSASTSTSTASELAPSEEPANNKTINKQNHIEMAKRMISAFRLPVGRDGGDAGSSSPSPSSPSPRHIIRKVVKVAGNGCSIVTAQDGEKRRVYRILPKGQTLQGVNVGSGQTSTSSPGVGTFIIPRAPGSIASTANAVAAAAAASAASSQSTVSSRAKTPDVFRYVPVSSTPVLINSTPAASASSSSAAASSTLSLSTSTSSGRRMMTIRSNVRPSAAGSALPRQILRRYSICGAGAGTGSGHVSTMGVVTPPRLTSIVTTTTTTPAKTSSAAYSSTAATSPSGRRLVRATTSTPPFKMPHGATPTSSVGGGTRATPTLTSSSVKTSTKSTMPTATLTSSYPITIGSGRTQTISGFSKHLKGALPTSAAAATATLTKLPMTTKSAVAKTKEKKNEVVSSPKELGPKTTMATMTTKTMKIEEPSGDNFDGDVGVGIGVSVGVDDPSYFASDDFMSISIKNEPAD